MTQPSMMTVEEIAEYVFQEYVKKPPAHAIPFKDVKEILRAFEAHCYERAAMVCDDLIIKAECEDDYIHNHALDLVRVKIKALKDQHNG